MTVLQTLEYGLARSALALFRALPPAAASNLGGLIARSIGPLLPVSRVAHENLRAAMPELNGAARRRIVRGVWDNLGRTVAEFPHLWTLKENTPSGPGFEVIHAERLDAYASAGGPMLTLSGHWGNWEMLPVACAAHGLNMAVFYRAAANPRVDAMIARLRQGPRATPAPMFAKGAKGARSAAAHLARRGFMGILVDQKLNDGIEATLFGMKAMTAPAAAALALHYKCPIAAGRVERVGPARLRLIVGEPFPLPDTGNKQDNILALTQAINDELERWIREKPEAWLWLHRRWPADIVRRNIT